MHQYYLVLENFINKLGLKFKKKKVPTLGRQSNFYIVEAPMNYMHSNQVCPHKSHSATLKCIIKRSILKISIMMSIKDCSEKMLC